MKGKPRCISNHCIVFHDSYNQATRMQRWAVIVGAASLISVRSFMKLMMTSRFLQRLLDKSNYLVRFTQQPMIAPQSPARGNVSLKRSTPRTPRTHLVLIVVRLLEQEVGGQLLIFIACKVGLNRSMSREAEAD